MKSCLRALFLLWALIAHDAYAAAIVIVNNDDPGEGFNDSAVFVPIGGNNATTLGQARLNALQYAADLAGARIQSSVAIRIEATIDSLDGDAFSATLGSAGPNMVYRNFSGAPVSNTWYVEALANARSGADLNSSENDISAAFNGDVDGPVVLGATSWYYGLDGNPGSDVDFVSVALHELMHGLGFLSLVDLNTGAKFAGFNDAYMRHLERHGGSPSAYPSMNNSQRITASRSSPNLHWTGACVAAASESFSAGTAAGHLRIYGPSSPESGSSVSHFDTALFPNELMEPSYTGANHDPLASFRLMSDIGWDLTGTASADLSVGMTDSPDPATVGNPLTYSISVTNRGPFPADDVTVIDVLPAQVSLTSVVPSQGSCSGTSTITCSLGVVACGAAATISIVVRPTSTATFTNTVSITSTVGDPVAANDSASTTTTVDNPAPVITALNPVNVDPGSADFTLSVNGRNFVSGVSVIHWNGVARATNFISSTRLSTLVPAADVATAGSASITVVNAAPGGGVSNVRLFTISESRLGGRGCFIATAAYGSPMAQEVRYLRAFRDQYMLTNNVGRWWVRQYYRVSPPMANRLRAHDNWRGAVRAMLMPFVILSKWLVDDASVERQTADRP